MKSTRVEEIAKTLLYEGYTLYPYRQSAFGNWKRPAFGVVPPRGRMQTECILTAANAASVDVSVRFLHLAEEGEWQKAIECEVSITDCNVAAAVSRPMRETFGFPLEIVGAVYVSTRRVAETIFRVTVRISNLSSADCADEREQLARSLVSTHTILTATGGEFVSLMNPPPGFREIASACRNDGTWPVLAGEEGQRDTMLSSPVVLYDYPSVPMESAGDRFDSMEIDDMLALRILTLTEEEKREMRSADEHTRRILERTEILSAEHLLRLHGVMHRESP